MGSQEIGVLESHMGHESLRNDLGVLGGTLWHLMHSDNEGIVASQGCAFVSMALPGALRFLTI